MGDSRAILARQSKILSIQLIEKVGNSFIFLRITNHVLRLRKKGFSRMVEGFMPLEMNMVNLWDHRECGFPIKVKNKLSRSSRFGHE